MPEEQFLKKADTGDILLFRSRSNRILGQWIVRGLSGSEFDHVGLVMRFGDRLKDMFIFEAVGQKGVRLINWQNVRSELYDGGFFEKIVWRKLNMQMTAKKLAKLDSFRKDTVGLAYSVKHTALFIT